MKTAMSWSRLGLRGRLFAAFGAVAALTVLASGSAIVSYGNLGQSLGAIAEKSLPEITRASKVVKAAGEVTAAAPRLLAATDPAEREQALKNLAAARQDLTQTIGALAPDDAANLNKTGNRILANLDADRNGSISRAELDGYIEAMVAGADADSDGGVSFSEARIFKIAKWRKALQLTSAN